MKPELNLINEMRVENIYRKFNKKNKNHLRQAFDFDILNEEFSEDSRTNIVHYFEQMKK
ncbi:hypothetical protein LR002_02020 [Candidatus Gracilibacteria bacterium]|nr:hypothetical protein [Candidatus Gracilibacteria bacterium]